MTNSLSTTGINELTPGPGVETPSGDDVSNRFAEAALERHKREGVELAVKARWIAMAAIAIMLPFINFQWEVLYYHLFVVIFALIGWIQLRVARVGRSSAELLLIFCDLALMTIILAVPNPFSDNNWPMAMQFRFEGVIYFYVLLAVGTLAYSWRTVRWMGTLTAGLWVLALGIAWFATTEDISLTEAARAAFLPDQELADLLDPNNFLYFIRVQEMVVFLIVAITLSVTVRRYADLLMGHAALERERANLARYFSPNVVEELSNNDEPLKQIRTQDVAVLFVDIVGFTKYAASRESEEVITTLREFHKRMENEVFRHNGTLDKYLGDGLMATFGTPFASDRDAINALRCARSMIASVAEWNAGRQAAGEPQIQASFGLHYGPAVLGDIGANRLEFAVIGNTVNVASRVEALTRGLSVRLAATDELLRRVRDETKGEAKEVSDLVAHDDVSIRGLKKNITVWTLA
ncbi:adenylate/guanylate cyclase domain-containing protein [Hoeflea sp.]|uniref:adenylate/guanylate cyclase domain-containing protein n=1 Tax=Hoeflea sp. TaxID=1940281 RepID=UPI003B01B4A6